LASIIDTYLSELRAELAAADPALVQDALYDAEEHMRSELALLEEGQADQTHDPEQAPASVIERYGTPAEVAAAYVSAEGSAAALAGPLLAGAGVTPEPPATPDGLVPTKRAHGFFNVMGDPLTWTALVYMLLSLVTGIVYFTFVVTGLSVSAGLFILIIGVPFALGFLALVRGVSLIEGRIVEGLLGVRMPRRPRLGPSEAGILQRVLFWLRDRRTWTAMLYMLLQLPLGIIYFTVSVTGLATGLACIALPVVQWATGHSYVSFGTSEYVFAWWQWPLLMVGGALLVLATLNLVRVAGRAHGAYAKAMLVRAGQRAEAAAPAFAGGEVAA
jgi:Putative sensor